MNYQQIITMEPGKRGGKPCIRRMRITVADVLDWLHGDPRQRGEVRQVDALCSPGGQLAGDGFGHGHTTVEFSQQLEKAQLVQVL